MDNKKMMERIGNVAAILMIICVMAIVIAIVVKLITWILFL